MIPNLFWKSKIPERLPKDMQAVVDRLKKSKGKKDCLRRAYEILSKKYKGCKFYTYRRFFDLFVTDLKKIWEKSGCLHCTHLNYLLRVMLVKSGFFKDEDIQLRLTLVYYVSVHQYLKIKIGKNDYVNVDLWGNTNGVKFGDYAHGFHRSE